MTIGRPWTLTLGEVEHVDGPPFDRDQRAACRLRRPGRDLYGPDGHGGRAVRSHPDDAAFLDRQDWQSSELPCAYGRHPAAPTIAYGTDRICRDDLAWRLHLDRCDATDAGRDHTPTLAPAQ